MVRKVPTLGSLILSALGAMVRVLVLIIWWPCALAVIIPWALFRTLWEWILIVRIQHAIEDRWYLDKKIHTLLGKLTFPRPDLLIHDNLAPLPQLRPHPRPRKRTRKSKRKSPLLKYTGDAPGDGIKQTPPSSKPEPPAASQPPASA